MTSPAWRTVVIEQDSALSCTQGQLTVKSKEGTVRHVPLFDLRTIMVVSLHVSITSGLINELNKRQISLIMCDEKKLPSGEFIGYNNHHATPAKIFEQIHWSEEHCIKVWEKIVILKIKMQRNLLNRLNLVSDWKKWDSYQQSITNGDQSNREGQAARLYFNVLFGKKFQRRTDTSINAALNYGYAILCSIITRSLVSHGYHTGLGINHCSGTNPLNLSYDLVEPFRPFVDEVVYYRREEELNKEFKTALIEIPNKVMSYCGKRMPLTLAADQFVLNVTKALNTKTLTFGETGF
ncbi:MAG: type II CRISPR-associated endonuclease Cas1 [Planctomycetia bacterium]|nr:type II CRISPR-associated endonuclease Cas1 [Planctomycetia bacterium]